MDVHPIADAPKAKPFWRRRPKTTIFFLLIALALAWRGWAYYRVQSTLAEIRAEGYPATPAELDAWYPSVPDEENAAAPIGALFHRIKIEMEHKELQKVPRFGDYRLPPVQHRIDPVVRVLIDRVLQANRDVLTDLHAAVLRSRCRYPMDLTNPFISATINRNSLRQLCQLLELEVLAAADDGRAADAVGSILAILRFAHTLDQEPTLISWLVRASMVFAAADAAEQAIGRTSLNAEQLAQIENALHDADSRNLLTRAMAGERAWACGITMHFDTVVKPEPPNTDQGFHALDTSLRLIGYCDANFNVLIPKMGEFVEATTRPWPEVIERFKQIDEEIQKIGSVYLLARIMGSPSARIAVLAARASARFEVASVSIAVERYRLAHAGQLPADLNQLVPAFIDRIPEDPFTGQPLIYKPLAKGFTVYSVGEDGHDDGGAKTNPAGKEFEPGTDIPFTVER